MEIGKKVVSDKLTHDFYANMLITLKSKLRHGYTIVPFNKLFVNNNVINNVKNLISVKDEYR